MKEPIEVVLAPNIEFNINRLGEILMKFMQKETPSVTQEDVMNFMLAEGIIQVGNIVSVPVTNRSVEKLA